MPDGDAGVMAQPADARRVGNGRAQRVPPVRAVPEVAPLVRNRPVALLALHHVLAIHDPSHDDPPRREQGVLRAGAPPRRETAASDRTGALLRLLGRARQRLRARRRERRGGGLRLRLVLLGLLRLAAAALLPLGHPRPPEAGAVRRQRDAPRPAWPIAHGGPPVRRGHRASYSPPGRNRGRHTKSG